ncbi:hypothetical protein D9758_008391 [Tetrapyrgos nigripes]|uniref:F-box domain-containing protein n=1 Tax=Tetrapyrgos nigripes TaxID=182062 RepID=A0A8H5GE90_9AGAR|nr:hypothetical protein D9758_008391 [Tetrapyrgos nigripes]
MPTLHTLPYDLLLNIAVFLDLYDIHALHLTCKSLYFSFTTRPVYRKLANDLLRRCRPLPLKGFQRLIDLSTEQFIHSVNKAYQYEHAWRSRTPQPLTFQFDGEDDSIIYNKNLSTWRPHACNNYLDLPDPHPEATSSADTVTSGIKAAEDGDTGIASTTNLLHTTPSTGSWYRIIHTPPGEDIHWLSPITSSYVLCATKLGKVVCWDIQRDSCLAEWNPGFEWELWKCRVDFDTKTVYFTMATVLHNSYDDKRITEFSLIRLRFSEDAHGHKTGAPDFLPVAKFKTTGVVMNIFILDPNLRLLSTFVWRATTNTIGLFVLLDWDTDDYVYVDTGIDCVMSSNWSCILFDDNVVIHCEDCEAAFQHFYPLAMLREHTQQFKYAEDPKKPDSDKPTSGLVKMRRKLAASIGGSKNTSPSTSTSEVNSTSTSASLSASTSGSASTSNSTSSNPTPDADANPNSDPSNPSSDPSSQAFILKSLKEKTLPKISSYPLLPYESLVKRFTFPKPPPPTRQYTLMPVTQALLDLLPGNISNVVVDDYNDDEEGFFDDADADDE